MHRERTVGGIDALRKPWHHVRKRFRAAQHMAEGVDDRFGGDVLRILVQSLDVIEQKAWKSSVFDPKALSIHAAVEKIDSAGDRRSVRGVHLARAVEGGRQEVSIGAPVAAQNRADLR